MQPHARISWYRWCTSKIQCKTGCSACFLGHQEDLKMPYKKNRLMHARFQCSRANSSKPRMEHHNTHDFMDVTLLAWNGTQYCRRIVHKHGHSDQTIE